MLIIWHFLILKQQDVQESHESLAMGSSQGSPPKVVEDHISPLPGLRRRAVLVSNIVYITGSMVVICS